MSSEEIKPGYTRVTEILSQWDKMSMIDPTVLERKRVIGTNVHSAIRDYYLCLPSVLSNEEGGAYYQSFLLWNSKVSPLCIASELRLYDDELMITGSIDALMVLPGGGPTVLVDWKCTANPDKQTWPLQGCFYKHLLEVNGHKNLSDKFLFVKLSKLGEKSTVYEFEYTDELWETCKGVRLGYLHQKPWLDKRKNYVDEESF